MSERWIKECKSALETLRKLSAFEDKDRLEMVKSIKTSLGLMARSLAGWMKWLNNPGTMASFSKGELREMDMRLSEIAGSFIKYDIEASNQGLEKGLKTEKTVKTQQIRFII